MSDRDILHLIILLTVLSVCNKFIYLSYNFNIGDFKGDKFVNGMIIGLSEALASIGSIPCLSYFKDMTAFRITTAFAVLSFIEFGNDIVDQVCLFAGMSGIAM